MMCKIDGCDGKVHGYGYCRNHYERLRKYGDPLAGGRSLCPRGAPARWIAEHVNDGYGECLIWPFQRDKDGYAAGSRGRPCRIMCEKVNGPPPSKRHVSAHSCGKGHLGCIHPKHLRWATQQENIDDKFSHGTNQAGERHNLAKLTREQVEEIRGLRGSMTQGEVAAMFSISKSNVGMIQRGQTWR